MEKKIFLIFFLLFSGLLFSQEKYKIELHNKAFESSFVYSINSNIKSDFKINIVSTKNSNKQTCDEDVNFINNSDFHIYISNGVVRRRLIAHATAYNNGDMSFTLLVSVEYDGYEMLE